MPMQLILEPETARRPGIVVEVPGTAESEAPGHPLAIRNVSLGAVSHAPSLRHAVPRLLTFWKKYRWYRSLGYARAAARDKAWWHAREAPCPLSGAAH